MQQVCAPNAAVSHVSMRHATPKATGFISLLTALQKRALISTRPRLSAIFFAICQTSSLLSTQPRSSAKWRWIELGRSATKKPKDLYLSSCRSRRYLRFRALHRGGSTKLRSRCSMKLREISRSFPAIVSGYHSSCLRSAPIQN